jgi:hypothetical protein
VNPRRSLWNSQRINGVVPGRINCFRTRKADKEYPCSESAR